MKRFSMLPLLFLAINCYAQDTIERGFFKETSISLGYNYNFFDSNVTKFHLIEARYQLQKFGGHHPVFSSVSSGFDVGINTDKLILGPRVGAKFGYLFIVGADIAYYTDFSQGTLRLIPAFGWGFEYFSMTFNPHILSLNKEFEPVNRAHFNVTVKLFKLKRTRLELKNLNLQE